MNDIFQRSISNMIDKKEPAPGRIMCPLTTSPDYWLEEQINLIPPNFENIQIKTNLDVVNFFN